jgi:hypothetical protein
VLDKKVLTDILTLPQRKPIAFQVDTNERIAIRDILHFGKVSCDQFIIAEDKAQVPAELRGGRNRARIRRSVKDNEKDREFDSHSVKTVSRDVILGLRHGQ